MRKLLSLRKLFQNFLVLGLIVLAMSLGLHWADSRITLIRNMKPYYSAAYIAAWQHHLSKAIGLVAGQNNASGDSGAQSSVTVPVLLYHGIIEHPDGENVPLKNFISQLQELDKAGWHSISLTEFDAYIRDGKKLPPKSFLITFDDGRKDSFYPVDPLLAAYGDKAAMFIITKGGSLGPESPFYLAQSEITGMLKTGRWELASHSRYGHTLYPIDAQGNKGHFYGNKLWLADQQRLETDAEYKARVIADLTGAKDDLKAAFGIDAQNFAYPFGDVAQQTNYPGSSKVLLDSVRQVYPLSYYQFWASRGYSQNSPDPTTSLIKRILVEPSWDGRRLTHELSLGQTKPLPFTDDFNAGNRGWLTTWGKTDFSTDGMLMQASNEGNGASATLDGSTLWENYLAAGTFTLRSGSTIRLTARYQSTENNLSCTYRANHVVMERTVDGHQATMAEGSDLFNVAPGTSNQLAIKVNGERVQCLVNGVVIADSDNLQRSLTHGGIGITVYDPGSKGSSDLLVSHLLIEQIE